MSDNPTWAEPVNKKSKTKKNVWNIAAEVFKREYGFFQPQSDPFDKDCYSSHYTVKRMQLSHHLTKQTRGNAPVINFNCSGDLLCAGCTSNGDKHNNISLIDWAAKKIKAQINIENAAKISDVNFVNFENYTNQSNIISVYENGHLRHDTVAVTGNFRTTYKQQLSDESHKLAICPRKAHELLSASQSGNIYNIDLRSPTTAPTLLAQTKPVGKFVKLQAISHHPLAPQICCSYSDYNLRTFDKRRFDRPLHEIYPKHLHETNSFANFSDCIYSYDGSEILAIYTDEKIYVFDSENERPGEFKQSFSQGGLVGFTNKISFFGPKSEFVIVGNDGQCIGFFDKVTGKYEKGVVLRRNARFCSVDFLTLKSHPHLPVVAVSVQCCGLSILSPSSKKMPFQDD